jgi:exosortase K
MFAVLAVKQYYSTANVNQLRWILAPTTLIVELVTGSSFEFESYAGYVNSERTFVIAASCAGVNFLIMAFLLLTLRKLWRCRSQSVSWSFIPIAAVFAYVATLAANTVRISTALRMHRAHIEFDWLSPAELHRFEGIFIYFGSLLFLYLISERLSKPAEARSESSSEWIRFALWPLLIYYATTLGIPLTTGAYRGTAPADFFEHSIFVLLVPLPLILAIACYRRLQTRDKSQSGMLAFSPWRRPIHSKSCRSTDVRSA